MPIRCNAEFFAPDGDEIKLKTSMKYLGSMLCNSGRAGTELSYRLGLARADFNQLKRVWSHTSIARARKLKIYEACILSKLLYCLDTVWLTSVEMRKMEAFHHKCLRKIAGVLPSYYSRVSNADV